MIILPDNDKKYHCKIIEAKISVCYCSLNNSAYLAQEAALSISSAKYPLTKTIVKNYSLAANEREKVYEDVFSGKIPSKMVIGFVSDTAYAGSLKDNPFNFYHNNISFVGAYKNGIPVPGRAFEPQFNERKPPVADEPPTYEDLQTEGAQYSDCYEALFSFSEKSMIESSIDISRADFCNGYSLFVFSIDQVASAKDSLLPLYISGNLRLEIKFKKVLTHAVQMIVYGQFPHILSIDKNRNILVN